MPIANLADIIPLGLAIADAAGVLSFVNAELERMTGYPPGALVGRPVEVLLPERNRDAHSAEREAYTAAPTVRLMAVGRELFARRADGSEFPVEVGLRPIETKTGPATLATVIDVSARRQLESSFRAIFEASPYGALLVDREGRITLTNHRLDAMFGYAAAELRGRAVEILIPHRLQDGHVAEREAFLRAPTPRPMGQGRDLAGRHKNGVEIPVEVALSAVSTAEGAMAFAAVVDITERKRAELKLREANARLEEFSYVASHDLRAPIRGLSSLIDFIREDFGDQAPAAAMRNLNRMQERVRRMEQLIEDLLTYARAGKRTVKMEPIDLRAEVDEMLRLLPPPDGMQVELDIAAEPFEGARVPIGTVLRNLYGNAIKHHDRREGRICIRARDDGGHCVIDVRDDGPGIPEAAHARVFRLFQTLSAGEGRGSGLGLALTQRLIEGHGGNIELFSRDGERGTLFRVWWPRFMRTDLDD